MFRKNRNSVASVSELHYDDVIMGSIASQITSLTIVYSTVYSGADQSKHQSSASLAFVWGIHRGPVNSPHKWSVTRKMFPFDDVIMIAMALCTSHVYAWQHRVRIVQLFLSFLMGNAYLDILFVFLDTDTTSSCFLFYQSPKLKRNSGSIN